MFLYSNATKKNEPILVPSSCSDLNKIGVTLVASILVQREGPNNNNFLLFFATACCILHQFQTIWNTIIKNLPGKQYKSTSLSFHAYTIIATEKNFGRFNMKCGPGFFFFVQGFGSNEFQTAASGAIRYEKERLENGSVG